METLYLKRDHDRRVKRGHPWVYSNEIDVARAPLRSIAPGTAVRVCDANDTLLGIGHASPASLIAVRLLARRIPGTDAPTLEGLIEARIRGALAARQRVFAAPFYRLVYGEGDGLPGLVVDRFGEACVVQTTTWGMESRRNEIIDALDRAVAPRTLVIKNDSKARAAEGLPVEVVVLRGSAEVQVEESGACFVVDAAQGQKTGWFYDQRINRNHPAVRWRDSSVLDLYGYVGAWSVLAARAGARRAVCVDSSAAATASVCANAERNGVGAMVDPVHADVETYLAQASETYDVVVLDPPALVPRRKDLKAGRAKYRHLNSAALARVSPGGTLVTCSCSSQVDAGTHLADVRAAARQQRRDIVLTGRGSMPPDHPIHPLLPEMEYLKCLFLRVE